MPAYKWLLAGCCAALLGTAAWLHAASAGKPAHLAGMGCGDCHLAGKDVTAAQASKLMASQEVLCGSACHPKAVQISHPSGLVPKAKLPAEYPVDWKGDLTCSTCHLVHATGPGQLRGDKRGKDMCQACHDVAFFANMKDLGTSIVQSGHLSAGITLGNIELDPFSLHCLGCHSDNFSAPGVNVDRNGILRHASGGNNHPIGRRYRESVRFGGYRPERTLSKSIVLPDGKISCVSCHQAYNRNHGKLVMANNRSSLCFQCHDL